MKPAGLQPGHRIAHTVPRMNGTLTVTKTWADQFPDEPQYDRVYADVEVSDRSTRWDPDNLAAGTGAEAFQWLGMTPMLRYRLVYLPDTDIAVEPS